MAWSSSMAAAREWYIDGSLIAGLSSYLLDDMLGTVFVCVVSSTCAHYFPLFVVLPPAYVCA